METTVFGRRPVTEAFETASELHISTIEMGLSHFDACNAAKADIRGMNELLSTYGLKLGALFALPGFSPMNWKKTSFGISSLVEADRQDGVRLMKNAIRTSADMGCKLILSELSGDMDAIDRSSEAFRRSIEEVIPDLAASGITLCFEPHPGDFIEESFAAVELLRSFHSKHVRYNYCVAHTFVLRHGPTEIIRNAGDMLAHVHVADTLRPERIFFCPTYEPKMLPHLHLIPGTGDVDFREAIRALGGTPFKGLLSIHPISHMDQPKRAVTRTYRSIGRMMRRGLGFS